jgi:hypothetical protein
MLFLYRGFYYYRTAKEYSNDNDKNNAYLSTRYLLKNVRIDFILLAA